jgi:hypothetical protein
MRLVNAFLHAGRAVRICQGVGTGKGRNVGFIEGLVGLPIVTLPASVFISDPEDKVIAAVEQQLQK